jgi:recombinational DNA repair ATPase RecF
MYTLAMMLCIINKSDSDLKLLIVDDMLDHLDDTNAEQVFTNLAAVEDTQIIVAGVKQTSAGKPNMILISK